MSLHPFKIELLQPNGTREEAIGPLLGVRELSIKRRLDQAGEASLTLPATDQRLRFLDSGTVLSVNVAGVGHVGYYQLREIRMDTSSRLVTVTADDALSELVQRVVVPKQVHTGLSARDILSELLEEAPSDNWSVNALDNPVSDLMVFYGDSLLRAVSALAERNGHHFRLDWPRTLTYGTLGDDSGVVLVGGDYADDSGLRSHGELALARPLQYRESSRDVYNRLWAIGGRLSDGSNLTMATSTYAGVHKVRKSGTDYYLQNDSSAAQYGLREAFLVFSDIKPEVEDAAGIRAAANELHKAADAWLLDHIIPTITYAASAHAGRAGAVKPGVSLHLRYKGWVDGYKWVNVDTHMSVVDVTYTWDSAGGFRQDIDITNSLTRRSTDAGAVSQLWRRVRELQYNR